MKNKLLKGLLVCVSVLGVIASAQAALIQDNLADNLYLTAGNNALSGTSAATSQNLFGQFDLNGLDYDYAKVTFSFVDDTYLFDGDRPFDRGEADSTDGYGSVRTDISGNSRYYQAWEVLRFTSQDIIETAGITIGDFMTDEASTSYMDFHTLDRHVHDENGYAWELGPGQCAAGCQGFELTHYIETFGYTGYFTFESFIPKSLIDSSLINGMLNYDIDARSGDFYLGSATIETFTSAVSVPEPMTTGLLTLGLLGLGLGRRKKMT